VTFTIRKHAYQTLSFRILVVLVGLVVVLIAFRLVLKGIKNRERQKQRLLEAEKRSLLSQMNPHFIFNSLNSIQHFIIQNDEFQANNYLTNFSSLIRRILENSKKNLISLNEEIATLTLYLDMEKLRFEEGFEYRIIRDQNIDYAETTIPPMMIQPFVENAIWHGLMPLESKGVLTITFSRIDGYFHCLICDNGIGREKAARLKGKKEPHVATGMKNTHDRINLLNQINKKKIELNITDLKNSDETPAGTLVELIIPLSWDKNI
jgi:LytS/YehU family sensor histidine kinase